MKNGFTLIEVLIVVVIIGIIAAVATPVAQGYLLDSKESIAKSNLKILRTVIHFYSVGHNGVAPGYQDDDPTKIPTKNNFYTQIVEDEKFLRDIPENPFNSYGYPHIVIVKNAADFLVVVATGTKGWIYCPELKDVKLDWAGNDKNGIPYINY